ncbi:sensor histidine kinase [Parasphingopyxis sp.]|uniref:sensor histidine kinase n=1 Tax=Parasphingopyxis sp. TaxID=1920299 RepID=UPI0026299968|nr:sensor histidine kinase [Parasphingopyxis sp.]
MSASQPVEKRFRKLPTGLKTLMLLGLALLPLGIVAIFDSIDHANDAREHRHAEVNLLTEVGANHLDRAISEHSEDLQTALTRIADTSAPEENCGSVLADIFGAEPNVARLTISDQTNEILCVIGEESANAVSTSATAPGETQIAFDTERPALILSASAEQGSVTGLMELTRESLAPLPQPAALARNYQITLSRNDETIIVRPWTDHVPDDRVVVAEKPIGQTGLILTARFENAPLTATELFTIALPVIMWAIAAILGWIAITLLLIRPLRQLREAVVAHADGVATFATPDLPVSAVEIQQLGHAFEDAFEKLQSHEEQLAEGLKEQTRLTREVHHRVKNNLQIIASLLNLHARAAKSDDSAAAYASIQRRVDALAIVQRNLFAELEKEAGLPLRPVLAELASGLQQSAPASVEIAITLDIDPIRVGQDIAAPACFLVTELVELAMLSEERAEIAIAVTALDAQCARLSVRSAALAEASKREEFSRYRRVLTGMARQLQSSLDEEESGTLFTVVIPTLENP